MFGNDVNIYAVINFNAYSPVKHAVIDFNVLHFNRDLVCLT